MTMQVLSLLIPAPERLGRLTRVPGRDFAWGTATTDEYLWDPVIVHDGTQHGTATARTLDLRRGAAAALVIRRMRNASDERSVRSDVRIPAYRRRGEPSASSARPPATLDVERLYWIDTSRLGRITLATGDEQVLAIGLEGDPALGNAIAVDAAGLYWIESGSGIIKRCDDR